MARQHIFYRSPVAVRSDAHRNTSLRRGIDFSFSARTNSVPLNAVEFSQAAGDFPIVFAGTGDSVFPAVVLGTRDGENLFVNAEAEWTARYIPGFIQRYPFIFSYEESESRFTLCIDEDFDGLNEENRGERLFDADGSKTQYLRGILRFLQDYQAHFTRTESFCKRLSELGLLSPMRAQFSLAAGEKRTLAGFMVVDREKLKALPAETVADLLSKDELECIFLHLSSLRHFQGMLEMTPSLAEEEEASRADIEENQLEEVVEESS